MTKPAFGTRTTQEVASPFCRADELVQILALLDGSHGQAVFVDAETGMGASTLLREVARRVQDHGPLLEVRSSPVLKDVPFAALQAAVRPGSPYTQLTSVEMYRAVFAFFGSQGGPELHGGVPDGEPLITVDNAEVLDAASAELISGLVRAGAARAVLAHSSLLPLPAPLPELWLNGLAERISLQQLGPAAAHEYCQGVLGGKLVAPSSTNIRNAAAGSPLLMRLMMAEALAVGALRFSNGLWIAEPLFLPQGRGVSEVVQERLRGLTDKERNALYLVAFAEPLQRNQLAAVVGASTLESLRARRLIIDLPEQAGYLRTANPIYGQVVRAMVPQTRSRLLHRQLQPGSHRNFINEDALLRQTIWSLDSTEAVPESQLIHAAVQACRVHQTGKALRLAEAMKGPTSAVWAACLRARAKYLLGDYSGAFEALPRPVPGEGTVDELLRGALLRELIHTALGHSTAASRADAVKLREDGEVLARANEFEQESIRRRCTEMAMLVELLACSRDGRYSPMAEPLQQLLSRSPSPTEHEAAGMRAVALALDAERLTALGRPLDAREQAAAALKAQAQQDHSSIFLPEHVLSRAHSAAVAAGNWSEVEELLVSSAAEGGRSTVGYDGGGSLVRGLVLLRQGRSEPALDVLSLGVESLALNDPAQLHSLGTALAYYAAARLGREKTAERFALMQRRGPGMHLIGSHQRAFVAAGQEHLKGDGVGLGELLQLADAAHARGLPAVELNALVLALDFAPDKGTDRLLAVAGRVQGRWSKAMAHYSDGVGSHSAAEQLSAAQHLANEQLFSHAAYLFDQAEATAIIGRQGRLARAARAGAVQAKAAMGSGAEARGHELIRQATSVVLTRREREIAALAARGVSDAEIAARLHLSVRTIEGHLYHCYAKLNITSRSELTEVL
ncbi:helix-turn-helix transcriptional regulator [Arthrobacter sp. H35-D1]|uniref:helix-turn-helix transcriptional regulator n=1 Tax=Arthrobacter sp. H35-D1 TaxID=3046202 RepID=UPI0024B991DF|nr:helix-turn-helix transcriptional regulator [Arthrobacter sp. H35-D1]MDJ0312346.1 helix-turn-helix transcriptional regulator [Arthrobacter sp. H35-D1]